MMARYLILNIVLYCLESMAQVNNVGALHFVDQLIGTDNGGNAFAGASLPYGMAKAVADVSGQNTGGFSTDGTNITGFSHMHDSGTGGQPSMGQFPLFPQSGPAGADINTFTFMKYDRAVDYDNGSIIATPGYFSIGLVNNISSEMTVTEHAALYHFKFPLSVNDGIANNPIIILDLTDLADSRQNASISVDAQNGRMSGNGTFLPSFGSGSYVLHYCADFQGAQVIDTGVYVNSRGGSEPKELFVTRGINLFYIQAGGWVRFASLPEDGTIAARVGVSFVSAEQACRNIETEMCDWDFAAYHQTAKSAWRQKLSPVTLDAGGASEDLQKTFWSGIYRSLISPQNYTGENPLWQSTEPYFDSFYCIWDQFRAQFPLLAIIDPLASSDMMRSLLDTYKHEGWLPDCRMTLSKGFTQGGSNADVVLTDMHLKGIPGINWTLAIEAIMKDAEVEPIDWSVEGRGGLTSWKGLNYVPYLDYDPLGYGTNSRSISRTLEYAYDDYCLANLLYNLQMNSTSAVSLVNATSRVSPTINKYLHRSQFWLSIFNKHTSTTLEPTNHTSSDKSLTYTGFFQPRNLNGTFAYQDPLLCAPLSGFCSLTSNPTAVFESSIFEYTFYVPHDQATLIELLGGDDAFVDRLNTLHEYPGLNDIGNEPSFLTVYQYHYAGRPGLSAQRAHYYIPSHFNASNGGLPGNDDSGAMGAFAVWSMMGLWPVPGEAIYLISAPFFKSVSVRNPLNESAIAQITVTNFDSDYERSGVFIQSVKLNGRGYSKNWIGHEFFTNGGVLEITLGTEESNWGSAVEDRPPSFGAGTAQVPEMPNGWVKDEL